VEHIWQYKYTNDAYLQNKNLEFIFRGNLSAFLNCICSIFEDTSTKQRIVFLTWNWSLCHVVCPTSKIRVLENKGSWRSWHWKRKRWCPQDL